MGMTGLDFDKPGGGEGVSLLDICWELSPFPILRESEGLSMGVSYLCNGVTLFLFLSTEPVDS